MVVSNINAAVSSRTNNRWWSLGSLQIWALSYILNGLGVQSRTQKPDDRTPENNEKKDKPDKDQPVSLKFIPAWFKIRTPAVAFPLLSCRTELHRVPLNMSITISSYTSLEPTNFQRAARSHIGVSE